MPHRQSCRMVRLFGRVIECASAILVLLLFQSKPVQAAPERPYASLTIRVTNDQRSPIANAQVALLSGDVPVDVLRTDARGNATFENVLPGDYDATVLASGYPEQHFLVRLQRGTVALVVSVTVKQLATIANTHTRASVVSQTINRDARSAFLFQDLASMLNDLGNASVSVSSNGSLLGVSLEGKDPSLTRYEFNGVSIPGSSAISALNPDLLSSAYIDDQRNSLDFGSLSASSYPIYELDDLIGGYGGSNLHASVQNTAGVTSYAAAYDVHSQNSILNGVVYPDTSGFSYRHEGGYGRRGIQALLSVPINSEWQVQLQDLSSKSLTLPILTVQTGDLPSGYGPKRVEESHASNLLFYSANGNVGSWFISAKGLALDGKHTADYLGQFVGGIPAPNESSDGVAVHSFNVFAMRSLGGGTLNLNLSTAESHTFLTTVADAASTEEQNNGVSQLTAIYNFTRPRLVGSLSSQIQEQRGTQQANAWSASGQLTWNPTQKTSWFASVIAGKEIGDPPSLRAFSLPQQATYDCTAHTITADAPSDVPSTPGHFGVRGGLTAYSSRWTFSGQIYNDNYRGMTITSALVDSRFEDIALSPSYLAALQAG